MAKLLVESWHVKRAAHSKVMGLCNQCHRRKVLPHRSLCRKCRQRSRSYSQTHRKQKAVYLQAWKKRNKDRVRETHLRWRRKRRRDLFKRLGNKCKHCGFSDPRALQIDHKKGGGLREIKSHTSYQTYLLTVWRNLRRYQLLCANCNWIKRHVNEEC